MTVGVLLPLACIVLSLGAMVGALVYFNLRERATYTNRRRRF